MEYPCAAGTWAAAGTGKSTSGSCTNCAAGNLCREGAPSGTDATLCGAEGYLCLGGATLRSECTAGEFTSDGSTCGACGAGSFCSGAIPETGCPPGYSSTGSQAACDSVAAGTFTSTTGQVTPTTASAGNWSLLGDVGETTCEGGYYCTGGVKTVCSAGNVCAQGSGSETP